MKEKVRLTLGGLMLATTLFAANATTARAQNSSVKGSGAPGRITKWVGVDNPSREIGNSVIAESPAGQIGVGTTTPTSKLTVAGTIETTAGGVKFPDGTLQTTAGLASINHDATLRGNGTPASPLGIAPGQAVRSLNGLTDNVTFAAGPGISITPAGNTLTIASTAAEPAKNAFQHQLSIELFKNDEVQFETRTIPVPPGKRLVIEYLSINIQSNGLSDGDFNEITITTTVGGVGASYSIQAPPIVKPIAGLGGSLDKVVRIYSDSDVSVEVGKDFGGGAFFTISVSGYLVDLP